MKLSRSLERVLLLAVLFLALALPGLAQEEVAAYLQATDPITSGLANLNREYPTALRDFRQKRDLVGLRAYLASQCAAWTSLRQQLDGVAPPAEGATYQSTLARMLEVQLGIKQIALQIADSGLVLTADVRAMRDASASEADIQGRIDRYSADADEKNIASKAFQDEARALDQTLKSEHERLAGMLPLIPEPAFPPDPDL